MQREMRRRGGGFGFDEDRVQVFDAAGTFVPGPAPDVRGERVLAVRVVAVNEEVVSARDIAAGVADDAVQILRLHATSLGGRIAALVSSVAGSDAAGVRTLAAFPSTCWQGGGEP
ncbi:hypothetical protein LKO27_11300 [Tessaracoccus sp. OS52]|uniref:hypothetical protein n=1 Tax=Tessaracoccus sp. OS52 TaxID=2886691 RepID=UPI001D0F9E10|nr:hypothetical protein [Tessaracoccus sp. OS52]MCC2593992.1 hypothetical protein [Tessaracoccus sp. OS52]